MPYTPVPARELQDRLARLRTALTAEDEGWSMVIIEGKINLYYLTGTMQDGALIITPQEAAFFVRRSYETAMRESTFTDLRPLKSFRSIAEAFSIPQTVYLETRTMTLDKLKLLQKHLPFSDYRSVNGILSQLRAVKSSYELDCMLRAGKIQAEVLEKIVPSLLSNGISEAVLCSDICRALLQRGAMGISRFNQSAAEDVLGIASFGENALYPGALDSPSGTVGTSLAMKSIGSSLTALQRETLILLDIPSGWCGYHTDKSICYFYGSLARHPQGETIRSALAQCVEILQHTAARMIPGAIPSELYEQALSEVDPAFSDGFMNGCRFLGHSLGLTMDETPVLARGFNAPLAAGMTFAVEPKIALPGIGLVGAELTFAVQENGAAVSLNGAPTSAFEQSL